MNRKIYEVLIATIISFMLGYLLHDNIKNFFWSKDNQLPAAIRDNLRGIQFIHDYGSPASDGQNIFIGVNVGNSTMDPAGGPKLMSSYNIAVGHNSLSLNTTGHSNSVLGHSALNLNTTGFHNSVVGRDAMGLNTTGRGNSAFGRSAMYLNKSGIHNSAFGLQALYSNTTGNHNAAFGRDANFSNTTGSWNSGFGVDAIPGVTTGSGNSALGGEAGYTENLRNQNVTGSNNTWVGYQSGPASTLQVDNTIGVGYRAKTSKSNQAVFGSPFITETLLYGNVGIGLQDPKEKLSVNGTIRAISFVSDQATFTEKLCVGATCVTPDQFKAMITTFSNMQSDLTN